MRQERYAWPNTFRHGQLIPAVEYVRANRIRTLLMRELEERFEKVDVYATPTFGGDNLLLTNLTGTRRSASRTGSAPTEPRRASR